MGDLTYAAVFLAGTISFLSPCVLPLVPPYLTYLAGSSMGELLEDDLDGSIRKRIMLNAVLFVLGFSTVFIALGASASTLGGMLRVWAPQLSIAAGLVIVVMGLHFLGLFRISLLFREARFQTGGTMAASDSPTAGSGSGASYLMGLAFAFGWTPCIGPVLGAIIPVAASRETVAEGIVLFALYSAGLGIPFLIAALFVGRFMRFLSRFKRHLGTVEKVTGGLLVLTGLAFLTGSFQSAGFWLLETVPVLGMLG